MTPQKFVYTASPYREFRGYVFANGKPVTITDRGALEAIRRDPTFEEYHEETTESKTSEAEAPEAVLNRPILTVKKRGWPLGKPRK